MQEGKHIVTIEQKKLLTVTAVESVIAFSEVKIVLALQGGSKLTIMGTGLKITGFSKATGVFTAEGTIMGVNYGGKSFASRFFK